MMDRVSSVLTTVINNQRGQVFLAFPGWDRRSREIVHHQTEQIFTQTRHISQKKLSCRASKPEANHSMPCLYYTCTVLAHPFLPSSVHLTLTAQRKLKSIVLKAEGMGISMAEIFGVFDKDGSGVITTSELTEGLESLGVFEEDISREEVVMIGEKKNICCPLVCVRSKIRAY